MNMKTSRGCLAAFVWIAGLAGCAHVDRESDPAVAEVAPPRPELAYVWNPELSPAGPLKIDIYPDRNRLFVFRNGIQIGTSILSAGKEGHDTPAGNYPILQKEINHRSNLYGSFVDSTTGVVVKRDAGSKDAAPAGTVFKGALMPYFLRLTHDGIGLHIGDLPGYNASHGCIRLPGPFARLLYDEVAIGTPVTVMRDAAPAR